MSEIEEQCYDMSLTKRIDKDKVSSHNFTFILTMQRVSQAFFRTNFGAGKTGLKVGYKESLSSASSTTKQSNMPFWRGRLGGSNISSNLSYASGMYNTTSLM